MAVSITNQKPNWLQFAEINQRQIKTHDRYPRNLPLPQGLSVSSLNQSLNGSCVSTEDQEIVQRPFYSNKEFRGLQANPVEITIQQESIQGCLSSSVSEQQQVNEVYSGNGGGFFTREQHPECNNLDESKFKYIFKYSQQPDGSVYEQEKEQQLPSVNSACEHKQSQNNMNINNQIIKSLILKSPQVQDISRNNKVDTQNINKNGLLVAFEDKMNGQRTIKNEYYSMQSKLFFKSNLQNRRNSLGKIQKTLPNQTLIECQQDSGVFQRRKSMDTSKETKVLARRKSVEMITKSNIIRNDYLQNYKTQKGSVSSGTAIVTPNQDSNRNCFNNPSSDKGMAYKYYKRISEYVSDHKNVPSAQSSNQSTTKKVKSSAESNQHSLMATAQKQVNNVNSKVDSNMKQVKQKKSSILATKSTISSAMTSIKPSRRVSEALVNVIPEIKLFEHQNIDQNKENIPENANNNKTNIEKHYEKSPEQSPYFLKKQKAQAQIEIKQITIGSLLVKGEDDMGKVELQTTENIVAWQKAEDNMLLMKLYQLQEQQGDGGVENEIEEEENIQQQVEQIENNKGGESILSLRKQDQENQCIPLIEGTMKNNQSINVNVIQSQQMQELSQNLHEESSSIYWDFSFVDYKKEKPEFYQQRPHIVPRLELDQSKKPQNQLNNSRNSFVEYKPVIKINMNNRRKSNDQLGRREDTTTTEFKTKCLLKETSKHTNIIQERIQALQSTFLNQQQCVRRKKSQGKLLTMN